MSNKKNIEFIDKNIEKCKELINDIENTSDELKGIYDEEEIIKARAEMKEHVIEQLKQFEEIKIILEAWEIAKEKEIDILSVKTTLDLESFNIDLVKAYQLTDYEFKTIRKALEVEN